MIAVLRFKVWFIYAASRNAAGSEAPARQLIPARLQFKLQGTTARPHAACHRACRPLLPNSGGTFATSCMSNIGSLPSPLSSGEPVPVPSALRPPSSARRAGSDGAVPPLSPRGRENMRASSTSSLLACRRRGGFALGGCLAASSCPSRESSSKKARRPGPACSDV